ncbi:MAG: dipeptidase [Gemmatimonadaceae bacterium]
MHLRSLLALAAIAPAASLAACAGQSNPPARTPGAAPTAGVPDAQLVARARVIHDRAVTIDTHDDIPFNFATPEVDPGTRGARQVDIPKMVEGGLDAAFFVVYVGQGPRTPEGNAKAKEDAMTKFTAIHRLVEQMHPDKIAIANHPEDVERILGTGKKVAAIGIENGYVIGRDLSLVKTYYDLGARYMTLTHGGNNDIGDSATPRADEQAAEHGGLSEFGKQVVAEMNRVGMMVDVSHVAKSTSLDAIRLSKAPVIASHSGSRAVNDHARNMDDEQLRALQANGGVIQTVALGEFVKVSPPEKQAALAALRQEFGLGAGRGGGGGAGGAAGGGGGGGGGGGRGGLAALPEERRAEYQRRVAALDAKWPPATMHDFANHIDHMVKLIGIDHVGISSDFDGGGGITGWRDASETFNVTLELVRRGYTEEQIRKLWGGNVLRVWREVERVAKEMQRNASE